MCLDPASNKYSEAIKIYLHVLQDLLLEHSKLSLFSLLKLMFYELLIVTICNEVDEGSIYCK